MADSLFGSWRVFSTAPIIREESSLPVPPKGMKWIQDNKNQWSLIKCNSSVISTTEVPPELEQETLAETCNLVVDTLPPSRSAAFDGADDWELLSDKVSVSSIGLLVARAGSVRSISSVDNESSFSGSVPFKIQRTLSSSTIDSENGDRVLGQLDVDYMEHIVLPSDTLQGICLAYKTSGTRLRQANHFSGSHLSGAPKKLIIPLSKKAIRSGYIHIQNKETKEYKIHAVMTELPAEVKESEARA